MDLGISGQSFVVLGGTSGIGFAAARALLADGASVAVVGRNEDKASTAAIALGDGVSGRAMGLTADLGEAGEAERVLEAATKELGPLRGVAVTTGLGYRGQRDLLSDFSPPDHVSA